MSVRRDRVLLAAVICVVLLAQLLLYPGIGPLLDALGAETDLNARMWFLVAEFAGVVAFAAAWGALSDVTGRRTPWIVAGAVGGAAGYATLALVAPAVGLGFGGVLAIRVVQGAATIGAFSLSITMLMDLEGGQGRNMGAAGIAIGLGAAAGAPIGGQLTELDPLAPLYAASLLLLAVGLLVTLVADRTPDSSRSVVAALGSIRRTPALLVPYAFGLIDRLTAGFFALVGTAYFEETFALSPGQTGIMLALFFAPFALLQYPLGVLSDRVGRATPIVLGSVCYGLGVIAVGRAPTVELAGAAMVLVGVLGALVAPATMALVGDLASEDDRGTAMAGFNLFGSLGFLGGFLVGGTVAGGTVAVPLFPETGYSAAFHVVGGLEIAIALVTVPVFLKLGIGRAGEAIADEA